MERLQSNGGGNGSESGFLRSGSIPDALTADLGVTPDGLTEFLAEREVCIQTSGSPAAQAVARENWSAVGAGQSDPSDIIQPVDGRDLYAQVSCLSDRFYARSDGTVVNSKGETVSSAAKALPVQAVLIAEAIALGYSLGITQAAEVVNRARKHRRLTAARVRQFNEQPALTPITAGNSCGAHD